MKKMSVFFSAVASVLLVFVILATALQYVATNESLISNLYTQSTVVDDFERKRGIAISNQDLIRSYMRLADYLEGKVSSISIEVTINGERCEMFDYDQEVVHMVEVRDLWQASMKLRDYCLLACLIFYLLAALCSFKNAAATISKGYLIGFFFWLLVFGFFGTWASLDFHSFWTFFHQALFSGNDWLFDVNKSHMINMLPEDIFFSIAADTVLIVVISIVVLLALAILCLILNSRRKNRQEAEEERLRLIRERKKAGLPIEDELLSKAQLKARRQKQLARERSEKSMEKARKAEEKKEAKEKKKLEKKQQRIEELEQKAQLKAAREEKRLKEKEEKLQKRQADDQKLTENPEEDPLPEISVPDDGNEYASINEILYHKALERGEEPAPEWDDKNEYTKKTGKGFFHKGYSSKKSRKNKPFELTLPGEEDGEE